MTGASGSRQTRLALREIAVAFPRGHVPPIGLGLRAASVDEAPRQWPIPRLGDVSFVAPGTFIVGRAGVDLGCDAVGAREEQSGHQQIRIRCRIGAPEFDAVWADTDQRSPVAMAPGNRAGRLEGGMETLVGVYGRRDQRAETNRVVQQPSDEASAVLAQRAAVKMAGKYWWMCRPLL